MIVYVDFFDYILDIEYIPNICRYLFWNHILIWRSVRFNMFAISIRLKYIIWTQPKVIKNAFLYKLFRFWYI